MKVKITLVIPKAGKKLAMKICRILGSEYKDTFTRQNVILKNSYNELTLPLQSKKVLAYIASGETEDTNHLLKNATDLWAVLQAIPNHNLTLEDCETFVSLLDVSSELYATQENKVLVEAMNETIGVGVPDWDNQATYSKNQLTVFRKRVWISLKNNNTSKPRKKNWREVYGKTGRPDEYTVWSATPVEPYEIGDKVTHEQKEWINQIFGNTAEPKKSKNSGWVED